MIVGILTKNEEEYLPKLLRYLHYCDHLLVLDTGSTDKTLEIANRFMHQTFGLERMRVSHYSTSSNTGWDYSHMSNYLITLAEYWDNQIQGDGKFLMLDADELLVGYVNDPLAVIKILLSDHDVLAFPRYNLLKNERGLLALSTEHYPDFQTRAFKLHQGYKYKGVVHPSFVNADMPVRITNVPQVHIEHYGWCKDLNFIALKNLNYARVAQGLEPLDALPDDFPIPPLHTHIKHIKYFK